jgi:hypothetical protein
MKEHLTEHHFSSDDEVKTGEDVVPPAIRTLLHSVGIVWNAEEITLRNNDVKLQNKVQEKYLVLC